MSSLIATWSYSRLKDFEKCPYMLWLKAGEKRSQEHMDMTAADRGSMVHEACEAYVQGEGEFIPEMAKFADYFQDLKVRYEEGHITVEEQWGFTKDWIQCSYWDKDVWCRMKLDNFISTVEVEGYVISGIATDYKTGKKFGNEVAHNQQGQLYVIGSFMRYKKLEVCSVDFKYLDHGISSRPKQYTRQQAMKFLKPWMDRATKLTEATTFPPKANRITCKWCPFGPQNGDGSCDWGVDG